MGNTHLLLDFYVADWIICLTLDGESQLDQWASVRYLVTARNAVQPQFIDVRGGI
jgi:hypothetical protein